MADPKPAALPSVRTIRVVERRQPDGTWRSETFSSVSPESETMRNATYVPESELERYRAVVEALLKFQEMRGVCLLCKFFYMQDEHCDECALVRGGFITKEGAVVK